MSAEEHAGSDGITQSPRNSPQGSAPPKGDTRQAPTLDQISLEELKVVWKDKLQGGQTIYDTLKGARQKTYMPPGFCGQPVRLHLPDRGRSGRQGTREVNRRSGVHPVGAKSVEDDMLANRFGHLFLPLGSKSEHARQQNSWRPKR
ncbi:MAG: hypothetical protein HZA50_07240 [Planctomycetes bacterium]|nr:hypothetical protein [Planctomycetota bacterium]